MRAYGLRGPDPNKHLFGAFNPTTAPHQLPANVSYEHLFPGVENQGQQGTCVAFTLTAIVEAILSKRLHPAPSPQLSEIGLYSMTKHMREADSINEPGLFAGDALWVLQNAGYVLDTDLPYRDDANAIVAPVQSNFIRTDHELKGFVRVGGSETGHAHLVDLMCQALYSHGPLAIGIQYMNDWEQPETDGTLTPNPTQGVAGGHEMAVVGYSKNRGAFRVRQSWGTDFGDHGYVWLPFASTVLPDDVYSIAI